jgi:NADPH-dependent curcumin reductase CurA
MAAAASPSIAKTVTLTTLIPSGLPGPEHFSIQESPAPEEKDLKEGGILIQVLCMSPDPYLRGGLKTGDVPRTMSGFVSGIILASKSDKWNNGDFFGASLPYCTLQIVSAEHMAKTVMWKLTGHVDQEHISYGCGILGMPGATAYGGLIDVLRPSKTATGEVIWVSGSAGAVGSMVGQLAKQVFGLKVLGSCGGPKKCELVKEKFGFDYVIDYKTVSTAEELAAAIKEGAPDGIDMYFDNVGGIHFEAAMATLRPHGRVAVCGGISEYNAAEKVPQKFYPMQLIYSFQRVEGFMCMPWLSGAKGNFLKDMSQWLKEDKIKVEETKFDGIDQWPLAFQSLFTGGNTGKVIVNV